MILRPGRVGSWIRQRVIKLNRSQKDKVQDMNRKQRSVALIVGLIVSQAFAGPHAQVNVNGPEAEAVARVELRRRLGQQVASMRAEWAENNSQWKPGPGQKI